MLECCSSSAIARLYLHHESDPDGQNWWSCFSSLDKEWWNTAQITQEELSICGRWLVNGKPEEHFLTLPHVRSTDAGTITEALVLLIAEAT